MKKSNLIFIAVLGLLLTTKVFPQQSQSVPIFSKVDSSLQMYWVDSSIVIQPDSFFQKHKNVFGLNNDDNMDLKSVYTDNRGFIHSRYQQTFKGVDVLGAMFSIHSLNNRTVTVNGNIEKILMLILLR
jgi:Zn-dependent metalloprotease